MGWKVIIEDENGNALRALSKEIILSNTDIFYTDNFKLLKYIDPYGDTTFNTLMLPDLLSDLTNLKKKLPFDYGQIDEVIQIASECKNDIHSYLKFYGD